MSKPLGLVLTGKIIGEETTQTKNKKTGDIYEQRTIAIQTTKLQNILVDVPKDYVLEKDKNDIVSIPVETSARHWNNELKRFEFVLVKFYVKKVDPLEQGNPTL